MQAWFGFYSVMAGATATLLGLLFVAVSINAAAIWAMRAGMERLAEQAFQNYLAVLAVSLLAIFPTMPVPVFGYVTLAVIGIWALWVLIRLYRTVRQTRVQGERISRLRRQIPSLIGFAILVVSAARLALGGGDDAKSWLAAGAIVLLISATAVSWNLLLRVAKAERP